MCDVCRNASDESVASAGCVKPCHVAVVQCCHAHQRDSNTNLTFFILMKSSVLQLGLLAPATIITIHSPGPKLPGRDVKVKPISRSACPRSQSD